MSPYLLISLSSQRFRGKGTRPFRFEASWLQLEHCESVVHDSWSWIGVFPNAEVVHLAASCSDHAPLLANLLKQPTFRGKRTRSFRFKASWLQSEHCESVLHDSSQGRATVKSRRVFEKIEVCRQN
ncbi:UNVERIFIED_CONTAM: hypothetical protein Sradi_6835800 [Sesamum radiatum]|uniref:Uncharacterized protein n=1 Tax=Sesamum radiatum TaxID=300843 RepID=A0AAW2JN95_SESRA